MLRKTHVAFSFLLSAGLLGCPEGGSWDNCWEDGNYPVGCGPESCDFVSGCSFLGPQTWHNAGGDVVGEYDDPDYIFIQCTPQNEPFECVTACERIADSLGAVDADCNALEVNRFLELPNGKLGCAYFQQCDPDNYPLPDEEPPVPTIYCVADPSQNPGVAGDELFTLQLDYLNLGVPAHEPIPLPEACGYPVPGDGTAADVDQLCQDWCANVLLPAYHQPDDPNLQDNCATFVQSPICPNALPPDDGGDFVWQAPTGPQPSPLSCGEACCAEFGAGACYNFRAPDEPVQVATTTRPLSVVAKLSTFGVVTTTSLVGTISYSAAPCTTQQTCPLYIEALALHAPTQVSGTWAVPGSPTAKFVANTLELDLLRPALGGWRVPSRQYQLQHHSMAFRVAADVTASARGFTPGLRVFHATNESVIKGTIATSGAITLSGAVQLADGIQLTFSPGM